MYKEEKTTRKKSYHNPEKGKALSQMKGRTKSRANRTTHKGSVKVTDLRIYLVFLRDNTVISMPEVYKDPAEIFIILLYPLIKFFYFRLFQKAQNPFLQLPAPFTGNDLYQGDLLGCRFMDHPVKFSLNAPAVIINRVQIQLDL
jgi:hypothetical protein